MEEMESRKKPNSEGTEMETILEERQEADLLTAHLPAVERPAAHLPTMKMPAIETSEEDLLTAYLPAAELAEAELPTVRLEAVEMSAERGLEEKKAATRPPQGMVATRQRGERVIGFEITE